MLAATSPKGDDAGRIDGSKVLHSREISEQAMNRVRPLRNPALLDEAA